MRSLVCTSPGKFEYQDKGYPVSKKNFATIKIRRIGICGTDLHAFEGTQPYFSYPRILGHELSGELVEVHEMPGFEKGDIVTFVPYFNCGKCIACRGNKPNCCVDLKVCGVHIDGGMVEYLGVPADKLVHGQGLNYDQLAMVEPFAIGAHAVGRADVKENEYVLVIGAGPIGLGVMEFAAIRKAIVIAMDVNTHRLEFCKKHLGVRYTINASASDAARQIMEITNGDWPEVVMDATGNVFAITNAFNYMSHGGRYVLVGLQKGDICLSHPEFHKREATLMSSRNATSADFNYVITCIKTGLINPAGYVTHRTSFETLGSAFNDWLHPSSGVIKAMVEVGA
jgi:2-desacetyl-2-hydroxyethyl bacteriochlorophyllide A dehydrogenase